MLGEMGELPDIIEAALNHVTLHSPLAATYNRSRYRPQVAVALQRLADALDGSRWERQRWCRCTPEPDVPGREDTQLGINLLYCRFRRVLGSRPDALASAQTRPPHWGLLRRAPGG